MKKILYNYLHYLVAIFTRLQTAVVSVSSRIRTMDAAHAGRGDGLHSLRGDNKIPGAALLLVWSQFIIRVLRNMFVCMIVYRSI